MILIAINIAISMRTIQITVPEKLVQNVDKAIQKLKTTRSAFVRQALTASLKKIEILRMEANHRVGYTKKPTAPEEFGDWEKEQAWDNVPWED